MSDDVECDAAKVSRVTTDGSELIETDLLFNVHRHGAPRLFQVTDVLTLVVIWLTFIFLQLR